MKTKRKRLITYGSGDVQMKPKKSKPKDNRVIPDPIDDRKFHK